MDVLQQLRSSQYCQVRKARVGTALNVVSNRIHPFMAKVFSVQPFTDPRLRYTAHKSA